MAVPLPSAIRSARAARGCSSRCSTPCRIGTRGSASPRSASVAGRASPWWSSADSLVGVAALFDLDGTLIARNSAPLYMKHLRETGRARRRDVARTLYYVGRYKLGLLDVDRAVAVSLAWVRGRDEAAMRDDCTDWYARVIRPSIYPAMAATVEAHRRAVHVPVIVTSTTRYLAEPVAVDLGICHLLVTQLEVRDGRFTGEAVRPVCYGDGKIHWAERFAASQGLDLARSYF